MTGPVVSRGWVSPVSLRGPLALRVLRPRRMSEVRRRNLAAAGRRRLIKEDNRIPPRFDLDAPRC